MVIPILRVCVTTFFLQATTSPQAPHWKRHCDDCVPSKCSPSSPSLTPHRCMWGAIVTLLFWVSDNLAWRLVHLSKAVIRAPFRRRYNPKITSSLQTSHSLCQIPSPQCSKILIKIFTHCGNHPRSITGTGSFAVHSKHQVTPWYLRALST